MLMQTNSIQRIKIRRRGACQRCKIKKVRCDGARPKCCECERSHTDCLYLSKYSSNEDRRSNGKSPASVSSPFTPNRDTNTHVLDGLASSILEIPSIESLCSHSDETWNKALENINFTAGGSDTNSEYFEGSTFDYDQMNVRLGDSGLITPLSQYYDINPGTITSEYSTRLSTYLSDSTPTSQPSQEAIFIPVNDSPSISSAVIASKGGFDLATTFSSTLQPFLHSPARNLESAEALLCLGKAIKTSSNSGPSPLVTSSIPSPVLALGMRERTVYIAKCLHEADGIGQFFDETILQNALSDVLSKGSKDSCSVILAYTIIAIGSRLSIGTLEVTNDCKLTEVAFHTAVEATFSRNVWKEEGTAFQFQVSVALTYCAYLQGSSITSKLLADSIQAAIALQLNSEDAIQSLPIPFDDQLRTQRAFQFLYAFEKPYSMRHGRISMLDDNYIDHVPITPIFANDLATQMSFQLSASYKYAKLCSTIIKSLYSQEAFQVSRPTVETTISILYERLTNWKEDTLRQQKEFSHADCISSTKKVNCKIMLHFYEAVFVIHGKWHIMEPDLYHMPETCPARMSLSKCFESVKGIVNLCGDIALYKQTDLGCSMIYLATIATCILFHSIYNAISTENDIVFLSIIQGFFAQMSLSKSVPFREISDVYQLAQNLL